jgi:hypothetical protein
VVVVEGVVEGLRGSRLNIVDSQKTKGRVGRGVWWKLFKGVDVWFVLGCSWFLVLGSWFLVLGSWFAHTMQTAFSLDHSAIHFHSRLYLSIHTSGDPCGDHTASHQSTTPLTFSSLYMCIVRTPQTSL